MRCLSSGPLARGWPFQPKGDGVFGGACGSSVGSKTSESARDRLLRAKSVKTRSSREATKRVLPLECSEWAFRLRVLGRSTSARFGAALESEPTRLPTAFRRSKQAFRVREGRHDRSPSPSADNGFSVRITG